MSRYSPVSPALLAKLLVCELLDRHPGQHPLRVGLDAPWFINMGPLLDSMGSGLRAAGRPIVVLDSRGFYRDASLRFEHGKTDVESYYTGWLDGTALQREVLHPLATTCSYLPGLRDPITNRSSRLAPAELPAEAVVLVTGELLLGAGLAFDVVVHIDVSRQARRRLAPADLAWTLPAFDRYNLEVDPAGLADAVVRYDDPAHPALFIRPLPAP